MKLLIRIILSPIIFLWAMFLLAALTLFPLPLLVWLSFVGLILHPFTWLLNKSGSDVETFDPLFNFSRYDWINHLLGFTVYLWSPFAIVYMYIKTGEVFNPS